MTLLGMEAVAKGFGAETVLVAASVTLNRGDRVGVVGANGAGKTTLLELAAGRLTPDEGRVSRTDGLRIGYLVQEVEGGIDPAQSVYEYVASALAPVWRLEEQLAECEQALAATASETAAAPLLAAYDRYRQEYERSGGYEARSRLRAALFGVGFSETEFTQPGATLSGGQRVRAALARLLLSAPDVLLLDEPTNHLDVAAMEWLEGELGSYPGAALIVAHDHYFLDRTVNKVLEIRDGITTLYSGNYTAYRRQREHRDGEAREAYARHQQTVEKLEAYVRRYKAGNRSTQARSREHALARLGAAERPPAPERGPRIDFATVARSGREVLQLRGLGCEYPGKQLFSSLNLTVYRGQRLGVFGGNGSGKTTLLRVLAGLRPPDHGSVRTGAGVRLAYFSQDGDELPGALTVLDAVTTEGLDPGPARSHLARFGFSGEDVFKPVSALSGGEKSRLLLARLVLTRANLLLLDEPTNHLDLSARAALEEALTGFDGTLVLVTHDRYLLDRLATHLLVLGGGTAHHFEGNYTAYRTQCELQPRAEAGGAPSPRRRPPPDRAPARPVSPPAKDALEAEIAQLEARKAALEADLAEPELYRSGDPGAAAREYHSLCRRLEAAYAQWERAAGGEQP